MLLTLLRKSESLIYKNLITVELLDNAISIESDYE